MWVQLFNTTGDYCYTENFEIDAQNNLYIYGFFDASVDFDPSANTSILSTISGEEEQFIHKLSQTTITSIINVIQHNQISIYPNPSSTKWNVTLNNTEVNYQSLQLTDVTGKLVWSYDINETQSTTIIIPNTNLANGLYFLKTISKQGTEIQKLIKE